jgi:hypothetical protein
MPFVQYDRGVFPEKTTLFPILISGNDLHEKNKGEGEDDKDNPP